MAKNEEVKNGVIFPAGEKNPYSRYFVRQSYYNRIVAGPEVPVGVRNITFEPGCRDNWHIHRDCFQILLVTGSEGWYQQEGVFCYTGGRNKYQQ
jgi:quercetin dioxygenase-like cupin family protein